MSKLTQLEKEQFQCAMDDLSNIVSMYNNNIDSINDVIYNEVSVAVEAGEQETYEKAINFMKVTISVSQDAMDKFQVLYNHFEGK